jgi:hypothetical protein
MMQYWSDYLDQLRAAEKVIKARFGAATTKQERMGMPMAYTPYRVRSFYAK